MIDFMLRGRKPISEAVGSHLNMFVWRDLHRANYVELAIPLELEILNSLFDKKLSLVQYSHACRNGWAEPSARQRVAEAMSRSI